MSRIRANQFTDKAGTGAPTFPNGVQVTGVSTLGNTVVGGGTTQLVVTGNARITGILTIGTSSITLDGSSNQVNVGTGVTLHHTNGVQVGGNTLHSTVLTVNNINASGVVTATSFSGSGANLTGIAATTDVRTNSLVVSGITTVAAGSSAAPSITPTGDSNTGIFFPSADTIAFGEGGAETMRVNSSGELLIGTTTRTVNGGILQISDGITFPATQSACSNVNTLDDYEEGTFDPTVIGSSTAGTVSYNVRNGRYTKVGRIVHIQLYVDWSTGNGTGNLRISGLPFTSSSAPVYPALAVGETSNIALIASHIMTARIEISTAVIFVSQYPAGGGSNTSVAYDAAGYIVLGGSYIVD